MMDVQPTPLQPAARQIILSQDRFLRIPTVGFRGQLTAAAVTLYTAPTGQTLPTGTLPATSLLKSIVVCNTDTVTRTFTFYVVESGGSGAANRAIINAKPIASNDTLIYYFADDQFPLAAGEFIQGLSDLTLKVTVRLNVLEMS